MLSIGLLNGRNLDWLHADLLFESDRSHSLQACQFNPQAFWPDPPMKRTGPERARIGRSKGKYAC